MTAPAPGGNYTSMVSRGDTQALAPEQTSGSMLSPARQADKRRTAAARGAVGSDGKVAVAGRHVGNVQRAGRAWRARTKSGTLVGLHGTKQEAVGALVLRHEGQGY